MKRETLAMLSALRRVAIGAAPMAAQTAPAKGKTLDIYVADTEGGKAALFVSPTGQTLLIDSGNPGERDGDRILAMIGDAGVKQIDYLISTHYHVDHIGGLQELSKRIPIATLHRSRAEHRAEGAGPEVLDHLRAAPRHGQAHRREARRSGADHRPRLAHRHLGRAGPEDAAARRRPAESGVRLVREAAGPGHAGRQRGIGRERRDLRPVQADRSRRPALEQVKAS